MRVEVGKSSSGIHLSNDRMLRDSCRNEHSHIDTINTGFKHELESSFGGFSTNEVRRSTRIRDTQLCKPSSALRHKCVTAIK